MLTKIILENFKSHKNTTLELDDSRLHALVGKNSSGKTSILQAIYYLSQLFESSLADVFNSENLPFSLVTFGKYNCLIKIMGSIVGSLMNRAKDYEIEKRTLDWKTDCEFLKRDESYQPKASFEFLPFDEQENRYIYCAEQWDRSLSNSPDLIKKFFNNVIYLKLSTNLLSKPAYSEEITPNIGYDGSNLAPALDYIRNEAPEQFKQIEEMLKQVVPNVQKIGIKRAKVMINRQRSIEVNGQFIPYEEKQEFAGQEVVLDMKTGQRIPAHAISEGTMLTLGLLTVLMNPNQPNLVLLDDIEQGLHPKAQRELIQVFKQIIEKNPNLQIIFTTHSPYIIDELKPSQVHVLSNDSSGFTITKRLDEHPDVEWAIETLTTGEFWNAEGEDWVKVGEKN